MPPYCTFLILTQRGNPAPVVPFHSALFATELLPESKNWVRTLAILALSALSRFLHFNRVFIHSLFASITKILVRSVYHNLRVTYVSTHTLCQQAVTNLNALSG